MVFCLIALFGLSFCSLEKLTTLNQNISIIRSVVPAPRAKWSHWKPQSSLRNSLLVPVPMQTGRLSKNKSWMIRKKKGAVPCDITQKLNRSLSALAWCSPLSSPCCSPPQSTNIPAATAAWTYSPVVVSAVCFSILMVCGIPLVFAHHFCSRRITLIRLLWCLRTGTHFWS